MILKGNDRAVAASVFPLLGVIRSRKHRVRTWAHNLKDMSWNYLRFVALWHSLPHRAVEAEKLKTMFSKP